MLKIKTNYGPEQSILETDRATVRIGSKAGEFAAYDLMLGVVKCLFSLHAARHPCKKVKSGKVPTIEIIVTGEKRTEVPTTLEWVNLEITVTGDVDEKQFLRSVDLAAKYCSVHETISKVARMSHEVKFNPYP